MLQTWLGLTLLVLLSVFKGGHLEDLVIAQAGRLSVVSLCSSRQLQLNTSALQRVSAMAHDASGDRLLISGSEPGGQHRLWTLEMRDGARPEPVTFSGAPPGRLEGMLVSADHSALFATDATSGAILRVPLLRLSRGPAAISVLHLLQDDRPRGLAVDETNGLVFWTNWRFGRQSVERSRLDGSERRRLIDSDLYLPGGVAVDTSPSPSASLFFSDTGADGRLRVEVAAEDGSGRRVVYRGHHPLATGLQLAASSLYWYDSAGVWRLPLVAGDAAGPAELVAPLSGRPSAVLVIREDEQCASYIAVVPTVVPSDTSLPQQSCEDYCLVGRCRWDELRGRSCRCPPGVSGERCERDACDNFCLAGGQCGRDGGGRPSCSCPDGVTGERCQHQPDAQPLSAGPVTVLGLPAAALRLLVCGLLVLLALQAGLLAVLGLRLRRAVRARSAAPPPPPPQQQTKRFVAIGRQLRPRPSPPRKDIEDCCQMTLCETVRSPGRTCDAVLNVQTSELTQDSAGPSGCPAADGDPVHAEPGTAADSRQ